MDQVAIVILNYNGIDLLKKYLPSVIKYSSPYRIIVVDNASEDGSIDYIQRKYSKIQCIRHKENYGFALGYNKALCQIVAKYYVLLNNDVEVTSQWLAPLVQLMEGDAGIAVCQPKMLSVTNKGKFDYAGAAGGGIDTLGYPFCRGRVFDTLEVDHGQYDTVQSVFWASGACFFIRAAVFHQLGGFDTYFFAHFEEIDLCWRIHRHQWKVYCHGGSHVYHLGGGTIKDDSPYKTYLNFRNSILTLYKNSANRYKIGLRILLDFIAILNMLLHGKPKHALAIIKAQVDFQKMKQQYLPPTTPVVSLPIYKGYIVFDYFFRRIKYFSSIKA